MSADSFPAFDKERWPRLSRLLDEVLELAGDDRAAWLARLRAEDGALADEVAALLARHDGLQHEGFLETSGVPPPAAASLGGMVVGAYTLRAPLGQGGMGSVWLADRSDGRFSGLAAVKLLNISLIGRDGEARFRREGSILARLRHPNIARLIDAGLSPLGQPYLVLEHVDGLRIDHYCESRGLAIPERIRIFLEVLDAVAHAHANLIVHRDVKPQNVLVEPDGNPRLLDFGLARVADEGTKLTQTGDVLGTPAYMAPEQARGVSTATMGPPTDVYALGVLLYELLTGRCPFEATTVISLLALVIKTDPVWPSVARPEVPLALDAVVRVAMSKRVEDRYATAAEMRDDLERFLRDEPTVAGTKLGLTRSRSRGALAVGVGAVLLVVVALAVAVALRRVEPAPTSTSTSTQTTTSTSDVPSKRAPLESPEVRRWKELPLPDGVRLGEAVGEYVAATDGSPLVWIPPATFTMGSEEALKPEGQDSPSHRVRITRGYFIGKHEVTWAQYRRFCEATGRALPDLPEGTPADHELHPVVNVSFDESLEYTRWAGLRLPTEAEWELAARGTDARPHPWGREPPSPARCAFRAPSSVPVDSLPLGASPFGCLHMAGTAWEWVADRFRMDYGVLDRSETAVDPTGPSEGEAFVQRGGAFTDEPERMHSAFRIMVPSRERRDRNTGLRVARDGAR